MLLRLTRKSSKPAPSDEGPPPPEPWSSRLKSSLQLQSISDECKEKQVLRTRAEGELEPVTWREPDAATPTVARMRLASIRSPRPEVPNVRFRNASQSPVHLIWLDQRGNEVILLSPQCLLAPQEVSSTWFTYRSHIWLARDVATGRRMMLDKDHQAYIVKGGDANKVVTISAPPPVVWTPSTHHFFSDAHRAAVRTLLLLHHRLRCGAEDGGGAGNVGDAALVKTGAVAALSKCLLHTAGRLLAPGRGSARKKKAAVRRREAADERRAELARLPGELVQLVIQRLAPDDEVTQDVALPQGGHDDVLPATCDGDPAAPPA